MVNDLGRISLGTFTRKVVQRLTSWGYDYENKVIARGPRKGRVYQEGKRNGNRVVYLYLDKPIPVLPKDNQDYVALDFGEYECELNHIKKGTKIIVGVGDNGYGHPVVVHIGV